MSSEFFSLRYSAPQREISSEFFSSEFGVISLLEMSSEFFSLRYSAPQRALREIRSEFFRSEEFSQELNKSRKSLIHHLCFLPSPKS
jgi:hypothetical protein